MKLLEKRIAMEHKSQQQNGYIKNRITSDQINKKNIYTKHTFSKYSPDYNLLDLLKILLHPQLHTQKSIAFLNNVFFPLLHGKTFCTSNTNKKFLYLYCIKSVCTAIENAIANILILTFLFPLPVLFYLLFVAFQIPSGGANEEELNVLEEVESIQRN